MSAPNVNVPQSPASRNSGGGGGGGGGEAGGDGYVLQRNYFATSRYENAPRRVTVRHWPQGPLLYLDPPDSIDLSPPHRLNLQYYLWQDTFRFHLHPSIPDLAPDAQIADIATGSGYVSPSQVKSSRASPFRSAPLRSLSFHLRVPSSSHVRSSNPSFSLRKTESGFSTSANRSPQPPSSTASISASPRPRQRPGCLTTSDFISTTSFPTRETSSSGALMSFTCGLLRW